MPRVVTFGEAMLRLSPPGRRRIEQAASLDVWPAGSELNVAIGLARLGWSASWVSRLPRNPLGRLIEAHARANRVETASVTWADDTRLGLYFVEVAEPPRPTTALYDRAGSAFATLDPTELDWPELLEGVDAFHVSGITPALSKACATATEEALAAARAAGCHTSYDVNFRTRLTTPEDAARQVERLAPHLDAVLCSNRDAHALFGLDEPDELRDRLASPLVVLSSREQRVAVGDTTEVIRRRTYEAVDPIGAGDAFCAGFLDSLLNGVGLRIALERGETMSALKLTIPGDAPLISPGEVETLLTDRPVGVDR